MNFDKKLRNLKNIMPILNFVRRVLHSIQYLLQRYGIKVVLNKYEIMSFFFIKFFEAV